RKDPSPWERVEVRVALAGAFRDSQSRSGAMIFSTIWDQTSLVSMLWLTVPLVEKVLRPVIVYLALVVLLRVFGKRELAQLNPFDLVVLLSLSNTVQNAIIGDDTTVT